MDLISLLISLLILGLVIWAIFYFIDNVLTLPGNVNQILKIVISIIALIYLVSRFLPGVNIGL